MPDYKLLTPGPLTTTETVKKEMMFDHCTWDDDYKQITQKIRKELLKLAHVSEEEYTAVLMQGSGTFGVESVIGSSVGDQEKILVCANGAYGERMAEIAQKMGKNTVCLLYTSGISQGKRAEAFYDNGEAACSDAGERTAAGRSVRRAFYGQPVPEYQPECDPDGGKAEGSSARKGADILPGISDQSAVCDSGKRDL